MIEDAFIIFLVTFDVARIFLAEDAPDILKSIKFISYLNLVSMLETVFTFLTSVEIVYFPKRFRLILKHFLSLSDTVPMCGCRTILAINELV